MRDDTPTQGPKRSAPDPVTLRWVSQWLRRESRATRAHATMAATDEHAERLEAKATTLLDLAEQIDIKRHGIEAKAARQGATHD